MQQPFKPLSIPRGRVKSREGLLEMCPQTFFGTMLLTNKDFDTNTWLIHHEQV